MNRSWNAQGVKQLFELIDAHTILLTRKLCLSLIRLVLEPPPLPSVAVDLQLTDNERQFFIAKILLRAKKALLEHEIVIVENEIRRLAPELLPKVLSAEL